MADIERMRAEISAVYGGWKWKDRCARMRADQVCAIWNNFERTGRFKGRKRKGKIETFHQITIDEYLANKEST